MRIRQYDLIKPVLEWVKVLEDKDFKNLNNGMIEETDNASGTKKAYNIEKYINDLSKYMYNKDLFYNISQVPSEKLVYLYTKLLYDVIILLKNK